MINKLELLKSYVKQNIPSAEILEVNHTERILWESEDKSEGCCQPKKEGILILIPNEL